MQDTGTGTETGERQVLLNRNPTRPVYKLEFKSEPSLTPPGELLVRAMDYMAQLGRWGDGLWFQPKRGIEITGITLASGFRIVSRYPDPEGKVQ